MSRLTSTRSPCFIAKLREVAALWAMISTKQENATASTLGTSLQVMPGGQADRREPALHRADHRHAVGGRVGGRRHDDRAARTATIAPGTFGRNRLKPTMITSVASREREGRPGDVGAACVIQSPLLLEPVAGALRDAEHVRDLAGEHLDARRR